MTLEDSTTYQLILNRGFAQGEARGRTEGVAQGRAEGVAQGELQGRAEEARSLVLLLGAKRFGAPVASVESTLRGITDRERLERIASRILDAANWDDLLATP
ncbi:MAG: hypothetical protein L0241_12560 [Planctomycetia bacterium]|nr:hypothetical protein [Planctomycetia bacterium]